MCWDDNDEWLNPHSINDPAGEHQGKYCRRRVYLRDVDKCAQMSKSICAKVSVKTYRCKEEVVLTCRMRTNFNTR